jgi:outer membrane immunogenic protein
MKKFLLGTVALVAFAAPAAAADLAARPYTKAPEMIAAVYDWSGFYIGLNGGGGSSHNCWNLTNDNGVTLANSPREGCHDATGGLAGGQFGYRWQSANWVFGVEAQGDWADLTGSSSSATAIIPFNNRTKIDAIGLFTGQVGYAWNNILL